MNEVTAAYAAVVAFLHEHWWASIIVHYTWLGLVVLVCNVLPAKLAASPRAQGIKAAAKAVGIDFDILLPALRQAITGVVQRAIAQDIAQAPPVVREVMESWTSEAPTKRSGSKGPPPLPPDGSA